MKIIFTFVIAVALTLQSISQNDTQGVSFGIATPHPNAIIHAESPNPSAPKAVMLPTLNVSEIDLLTSLLEDAPDGLLFYDLEGQHYSFHNGSAWIPIVDTDNQNLSGSITGTVMQVDITDGASATIDLAPIQDHDWHNDLGQPSSDINADIHTYGKVGIGIETPDNQLHVVAESNPLKLEGVVEGEATDSVLTQDPIGVVRKVEPFDRIPPGAVMAFAMETVPAGWLKCNGTTKNVADYPDLFNAIGYTYGGILLTEFKIPDYRGYFLRGWANGSNTDPDADERTQSGNGNTIGDHVGTKQQDEFQNHAHQLRTDTGSDDDPEVAFNDSSFDYQNWNDNPFDWGGGPVMTEETGGSETRPKNIYVMYCIKF